MRKPYMLREQEQVADFHRAMGQPAPESYAGMIDVALRKLRAALILEEAIEFANACGLTVRVGIEDGEQTCTLTHVPDLLPSAVEMLDALGDILYVTYGSGVVMGADLCPVFDEIHQSNMTKIDPVTRKAVMREDGKVLKPASYRPPDIQRIIARLEKLGE